MDLLTESKPPEPVENLSDAPTAPPLNAAQCLEQQRRQAAPADPRQHLPHNPEAPAGNTYGPMRTRIFRKTDPEMVLVRPPATAPEDCL